MTRYLLCAALLFVILAGCAPDSGEDVSQLWVDCPGKDDDWLLCENCEIVNAGIQDDTRWYWWRYQDNSGEFTLWISKECMLVVK